MARQPTNEPKATPVAADADESFVQRWARLKEEAREAPAAKGAVPAPPPGAGAPADDRKDDDKPPVEGKPFDLTHLPPIESLTKESDFSLFMRPEVPDDMRNKALRRLWALDAALAEPDWLEMYMVDFNDVPTFPEGLKNTLYQVGKGYIDKIDSDKKTPEATGTPADRAAPVASASETLGEEDGAESPTGSKSVADSDPKPDA